MPRIAKLFLPSEKSWFALNSGQKAAEAMKGALSFVSRPRYGGLLLPRLHASGGAADGAARASRRTIKRRITTPDDICRFLFIINTIWGILESLTNLTCKVHGPWEKRTTSPRLRRDHQYV